MSHSLRPKSERSPSAPDLPQSLKAAIEKVKKDVTDIEAWEELNELCREHDRPDEAAALYTAVLDDELAPEALEDVGRLAADFCEEWYEDPAPTLEMLEAVLSQDVGQAWAFERLTVLLTVASQWDELLGAYDRALAATADVLRKQTLLEEAAKVARDFAGKPERASDYLKELLLLRLEDEQLASALERRFDEQGRHSDLVDIWTARLAVLSKENELKTRLQIAERHIDALNDGQSAYLSVEEFLEAGGSEQEACRVLEKIADTHQLESDVRRTALALLDKLYTSRQKWPEVISVVSRALPLAEDESAVRALHMRAVSLQDQEGNYEAALRHCAEILKLDSEADDVRALARKLAEKTGRLDSYADAIIAAADGAEEGPRRVELLIEAARILRIELGDRERATALFSRVEQDSDADEAARLLACQELSSLLEEMGRSEELLAILEKRAALETKAGERKRILGQAAQLATALGQGERGLGLWSLRLNDDPADDEALSAKIDLFQDLSKYQGLVQTLLARADVGEDPERQRNDLVRAAAVFKEHLRDLENAIQTWKSVEERFGRTEETLDSLVALSTEAEKHEQVEVLLKEAIAAGNGDARMVAQLGQLGDTQRLYLQNSADAFKSYRHALELDPTAETAISGASALLMDAELAHFAGEALASAFRRSGAMDQIVSLVEMRLRAAPDNVYRSKILLEAAAIEEQAGHFHGALAAVARAFALHPTQPTEAELHRLAEETSDFARAATAYAEAISAVDDEERAAELYIQKGAIEEERLGDAALATASYKEAVLRTPAEDDAVFALIRAGHRARLFTDAAWAVVEGSRAAGKVESTHIEHFAEQAEVAGDWEGSLEGLADRIASADGLDPQVAHDLKKQLAIWYRDRLGDPDSAEMVLRRAVSDHPQEDSLRVLAELQRRAPGKPLVLTLTALADVCADEMPVLREAGEVALHSVCDPLLARPLLERALKVASARFSSAGGMESEEGFEASDVVAWATDHLVTVSLSEGKEKEAVTLLEKSAELPFLPGERVARRFRAAEVAAQAGFDDRAVELCESVLAEETQHEGAITLLSGLHEKAGRLMDLLDLRRRELELERPQERRLFLRLDQARVLGQTGASAKERLTVLWANLTDLPGHEASIDALRQILLAEQAFEQLVQLLEEQASAISAKESRRAARLWEEAGRLAEEQLGDEARLATNYRLSASAHATVPVLDRLARIAEAAEQWESEVAWLQARVSLTPESGAAEQATDRRQVAVRLGQALVRSDDLVTARSFLEEELNRDPSADAVRQLLAGIYQDTEEWQLLADLLEGGVDYAPDEAAQVDYLRRAAHVDRRRLGDLDRSASHLQRALLLDPDDRGLRLGLADTLRCKEDYGPAAELLTGLLEEFGRRRTKERAVVHTQLARIAHATGNLDEALEQAEAAAKIERTDPEILMLLGQLAKGKGDLAKAEQAYRTLALIASRGAPAAREDGERVGESTILFELYRIASEKGEDKQARELLDSALEVATRDSEEAIRLSESLRASNQVDLLLSALEQRLESGIEGPVAASLLVTKANVLEQNERESEALSARLLALKHTPSDVRLIDATQKLAERISAAGDFWAQIQRLAESNADKPTVAGELWYRAGRAAETQGNDIVKAVEFYELSQRTGHKAKRAFLALDRILDEGAEPERVKASLARFVASEGAEASPDVLSDALYRLADFELMAGALDEGAGHLLRALEVDAQDERALSMLEPIVRAGDSTERLLILFLRVARKAASKETLLYAFRAATKTETVEMPVLDEAIVLARELDDGEALRELLSRAIAVAERNDNIEAVSSLLVERASLARSDEDYEQEALLLQKAIPCFEGDDQFELELRLAACWTEHLGLIDEGQAAYEALLQREPKESRVWRSLLTIYRARGRTDAVEQLIAEVEEHVTDEADLEALKMERIRLMVGENRLDEAEVELRKALDERPHMAEAANILAELLRRAERWDELRKLVGQLFKSARERRDGALVAKFGMELAQLTAEEDREGAMDVLASGLSLASGDRNYLAYYLGLYTDEDNQSERADVMEHLLALQKGERARDLAFELYQLRVDLGDDYGAGRALELGVKAAPSQIDLVETYEEYLRAQGEHEKLAEILQLQAKQAGKNEEGALKYAEAAKIYDEELRNPEQAAAAISKAYECDPSNVAYLEQGARYLVNIGQVDAALSNLKVAIESGDDTALADLLELRANIIRSERADDRDAMSQAAQDIRRALEELIPEEQEDSLQGARVEVLGELRNLHREAEDTEAERAVVLELAETLKNIGDAAGGVDALVSWVREHETDIEVARQLGQDAALAEDYSSAMFAYEKMVAISEGDARVDAVLLLVDAADRAGKSDEARAALEDAFAEDSSNVRLRDRLRRMYEEANAFEDLANILMSEADKVEDSETRSALLVDVGDLYLKAGKGEDACSMYQQALEIAASPYEITSKLALAYVALGEPQRAEAVLNEAVEVHGKRRSPELAVLQHGLAQVAEAMGDVDGMFTWLEAALMSDRNNTHVASQLAIRAQEGGRYDVAIKALQSLTLSKGESPMSKAEAYLRQAQISQAQGDVKKALLMARRAHAADDHLEGVNELIAELGG
jgi:tetratricopeptide (TPR) repeat protein